MTNRRAAREPAQVFAVLTVCLGNLCRSPLAEQLIRARAAEAGLHEIEVGSAGLHGVVGAPMDERSAQRSLAYGGDPTKHVGARLGDAHVGAADLILTMTRAQRDEVVQRHPRAAQRTFTIVEFMRLQSIVGAPADAPSVVAGEASPTLLVTRTATVERLRDLVARAARRRGSVQLSSDDDVVDPIDAGDAVHDAVAEQLSLAASRLVFGWR